MLKLALLLLLPWPVAFSETYGQRVLAAVLLCEAATEGSKGMTAVAEVIRTRADHWKISPLAVVKRDGNFACLRRKSPEQLVGRFESSTKWSEALAIARIAYNHPEQLPGYSKGATHYHSGPTAKWARGHRPTVVIGHLKFYKLSLDPN